MKRFWVGLAIAVITALLPVLAHAQTNKIGYYVTASTTGMENSAIILPTTGSGTASWVMGAALSYNTSAAEVAMCFDSATLPANNAIPIMACPLAVAGSAAAPAPCSFSLPFGGLTLTKGLTCACSTTGKKLTVDTTSGGNCYFEIGWLP